MRKAKPPGFNDLSAEGRKPCGQARTGRRAPADGGSHWAVRGAAPRLPGGAERLDHSPAAHVRRPRLDYESRATGLDRNEIGGLLVAAGLGQAAEHALISLLAREPLPRDGSGHHPLSAPPRDPPYLPADRGLHVMTGTAAYFGSVRLVALGGAAVHALHLPKRRFAVARVLAWVVLCRAAL